MFRCLHTNADVIRWKRDGQLIGTSFPPGITPGTYRDGNNYLVQTLTVEARPEYNGTEIVCVARFDDGSPEEFTSPAFLQGVYCNSFGILDCVHYYTDIFSISLNTGSELYFNNIT